MATLRLVFKSKAGATDLGIILQSTDELYRMSLWAISLEPSASLNAEVEDNGPRLVLPSREIYLPGSQGWTWRVIQGLTVSRAESGSIDTYLETVLQSAAAAAALLQLFRLLTKVIDPRVRAETEKIRADAAFTSAKAAHQIEETRALQADTDYRGKMNEFDVRDRRKAQIATIVKQTEEPPPRLPPAVITTVQKNIFEELHERTRAADEIARDLYQEPIRRGLPVGDAERLLREAGVRAARIERIQSARKPIERVELVDEQHGDQSAQIGEDLEESSH